MFLDITLRRNRKLIETAFELHQNGIIEPDTYVLDVDSILYNAKCIKNEADKYGIKLYFMTKQFGRNPYIASEIMKLGYEGAVAVDWREAKTLAENGIKLGNVGHLVQIPRCEIENILLQKPEVITVYSVEKAKDISGVAKKLNMTQNVMLRVIDKEDILYPAQYGGFYLNELIEKASIIDSLPNIKIYGVTSFPCFLYNSDSKGIEKTHNMDTLCAAKALLEEKLNIKLIEINTPSATCTSTMKKIYSNGGTHGEPGHGLTGTTPLHAVQDEVEIPSIVYVSEISHNLVDSSYCYGGGYYRRSNTKNALVGKDMTSSNKHELETPSLESIDYYLELKGKASVNDTAIIASRSQIFVTRSNVAVVKGIQGGMPEVVGIYDSLGRQIGR
jgi:predicted amino acid racemase